MAALTSPLLRVRPTRQPDAPITPAEMTALVALTQARGGERIAIGSGRDPVAVASARAIADAWVLAGGEITVELTWPEAAASWLRHATRFTADEPDLWVMLGPPLGWAQMTRRLLWSTPWESARSLLSPAVSDPAVLDLVGLHNLHGIAGVNSAGDPWRLDDGRILTDTDS